jgi:hypothetical protein
VAVASTKLASLTDHECFEVVYFNSDDVPELSGRHYRGVVVTGEVDEEVPLLAVDARGRAPRTHSRRALPCVHSACTCACVRLVTGSIAKKCSTVIKGTRKKGYLYLKRT